MKLSRYFVVIIVISGANFFSCATTASVMVTKPPVWNTSAISRITVMPFDSENSPVGRQVAQFFAAKVAQTILDTGKFTLIDYAEIARLEKAGENIADHVDAIFSGRINRVASKNRSESREDKEGKIYYTYYRDVDLEWSFMLKRAGDGAIIGQDVKEDSSTRSSSERDGLPAVYDMATAIAAGQAAQIKRYITPWQIAERRVFEKDTMKDPRMKQAKLMLKEGSFRSALAVYATIYQDSLNFAAGFNAALCAEILGDSEEAAALMRQVWENTGNPKAYTELARLQTVIAEATIVKQEYSGETDTVINSAVKQASRELLGRIPAGSRISFVGGRGSSQNTLDFILDELSAAVVNTGSIMVVDRQQINAIIAEQRFQLSGEVSDETAVSIGRLSGSQIIVACSITGASSQRRLRIRAIAVETGVIVYQGSLQI
jgi:tetratricopeptide (TPR) repeat protein